MNAGQLDERIEIKAKKIVENELGEEQPEEITLKKNLGKNRAANRFFAHRKTGGHRVIENDPCNHCPQRSPVGSHN